MNGFQYKHGDRPLEGYTIQRAVGRGGFGEVYFALSDSGREVALKAIQGYEQIELRGVSQCMNLKSPHLVTIFDVRHNDEDKPFVIMEYVAGPSLKDLLEQSPSGLGAQKTAFFLREMAKGLTYLHERGIVHRDLKPGNIFYEDGYVKIGDYGLSKAMSASRYSGQTITVGTVHYMAPEIGQGRYDSGVDIYALGCCLYEMLTGNVPFFGSSHGEILMKHLMSEPDLAGIEEPFAGAIRKSMAKDPAERYKSAQEMVEAVFGAEHVRTSVSCFSPDSLTMVAGRVAQKVAVGGPGSSADAVRLGPPPLPPTGRQGDIWEDFARTMDRFGQRMGQIGEQVGQRVRGRGEDRTPPAPIQEGPSEEQLDSNVIAIADARRDPLDRRQRAMLMLVTAAAVGVGAGVLGGFSLGSMPGAVILSPLLICWATAGISLARRVYGDRLRHEAGMFPHLAYGGLGCVLALPAVGIFTFIGETSGLHRDIHGGSLAATLGIVGVSLLLVDWRARTSPGREERVGLGEAFMAGLLAWILCLIFGGSALLAGGIMAGISLASQVGSPFDPHAVRRPGRKTHRNQWWKAGPAESPAGGLAPPGPVPPRAAEANSPRRWKPEAAHGGTPSPYSAPGSSHRRIMPGWARAIFLVLFALFLGSGLMLLIWAGMVRPGQLVDGGGHYYGGYRYYYYTNGPSPSGIAMAVAFGCGCATMALLFLLRAVKRTYRGLWSALIKPILMLLCAQSAAASIAYMTNERSLREEEMMISLAFTIFPGILFLVLAFITDRMVRGVAGAGLGVLPPRFNQTLPVSPQKRMPTLLMCLLGCIPVVPVAGVHRFYAGKVGTGILWLLTGGIFYIGTIVDIILISVGRFRDSEGKWIVSWWGEKPTGFPVAAPAAPPVRVYEADQPSAQPLEAVTASYPYRPAPQRETPEAPVPAPASWVAPPPPRVIRRTNWLLNSLGMLLIMPAFLIGLGSVVLPPLIAAGLPEPQVAGDMQRFFGHSNWPATLRQIGLGITSLAMVVGVTIVVVSRRHAGAAHAGRAVLGAIGLGMCISMLGAATGSITWNRIIAAESPQNPAGQVIQQLAENIATTPLMVAGVFFLLGFALLTWPERRIEVHPAGSFGGGAV